VLIQSPLIALILVVGGGFRRIRIFCSIRASELANGIQSSSINRERVMRKVRKVMWIDTLYCKVPALFFNISYPFRSDTRLPQPVRYDLVVLVHGSDSDVYKLMRLDS